MCFLNNNLLLTDSLAGKSIFDPDIKSKSTLAEFHNNLSCVYALNFTDNPQPTSIHPTNHGASAKVIPAPEYEDTAELLPPPLPPKNTGTQ